MTRSICLPSRLICRNLMGLVQLALVASLAAACAAQDGPSLPPSESMTMDLGGFTAAGEAGKSDDIDTAKKSHFNQAAIRVGWLNTSIVLALAAPVAVFRAALSQQPIFEDGSWQWDFSAKSGADLFNAHLKGTFASGARDGDLLDLEMKVTCTGCKVPTQDFVWYTGHFLLGDGKGHWQFFDPEIGGSDSQVLRIDYDVTDAAHRTLTFVNNRTDGHADAGDVIEYKREGDLASVFVHDESKALDYYAETSRSTGEGYLQVPNFNGGEKACWDGGHHDAPCP